MGKLLEPGRLLEVRVRAQHIAPGDIFWPRARREDDGRNALKLRIVFQYGQHLKPAFDWQVQV